jgi:hypothetical protein
VAQAQRSPAAVKEQTTGLTEDGLTAHFRSLLADLAITAINPRYTLTALTRPTTDPAESVRSPRHQVSQVALCTAGGLLLRFNHLRAYRRGISD